MHIQTLLLFSATVLPLICTPGPDMLFIASQAISGSRAGIRATAGVVLGYCVHSLLVSIGLAAVVAASPVLFEIIRWVGITYLAYLAYKLFRSAITPGSLITSAPQPRRQLLKGFLTALLNPKGMLIYVAILPQFMAPDGNATLQAIVLSATFMFWCAVVYTSLSLIIGRLGGTKALSTLRRRIIDGIAGTMLLLAAGFMAGAHR
jgi:threonine/homoserine/homoserine lactone efflux protein